LKADRATEQQQSGSAAAGADAHGEDGRGDRAQDERAGGASVVAAGLSRHFGPHRALEAVSLEIASGESFALLGANGAGKTTFIRLLTGYLLPSAGEVTVDGRSPSREPKSVQRVIGYVPESPRLYPELRVDGFLRFAAGLRGLAGPPRRRAIEAVIARFGLGMVSRRLIGHLSKGYQQRVSLAQAFLHEPTLLIVDEPTSGLDPLQQDEVREVIAGLRGQRTIVLCTHDLGEARALTDRAAILHEGRLVETGASDALLSQGDPLDLFRGHVSAGAS
jgi:ABC-2 type transport system ATP-binding protein